MKLVSRRLLLAPVVLGLLAAAVRLTAQDEQSIPMSVLRSERLLIVAIALAALTLEGVLCCLVAEVRFLPVHGIQLNQLTMTSWMYVASYLSLLLVILGGTCLQLRALPPEVGVPTVNGLQTGIGVGWVTASRKLLVGLLITALTIAIYSVYCLQFY